MVHVVGTATGGTTLAMSISEWRSLNTAVEESIADAFVSYEDAAAQLGIHRSTLSDWIAQGKLSRVLIDGRGFITAASISSVNDLRSKRSGLQVREFEPPRCAPRSANAPNSVLIAEPSRDALSIVRVLTNEANAITPAEFSANLPQARRPGMYAWWGDDEACELLGSQLATSLPHCYMPARRAHLNADRESHRMPPWPAECGPNISGETLGHRHSGSRSPACC